MERDSPVNVILEHPQARQALLAAAGTTDLEALATASLLRKDFGAELAAAALTQEALRRRAIAKFGEQASALFLTRDGLEQASRQEVAHWRAERYRTAGWHDVWDLGCGIGADSLAFAKAGLQVTGVERDSETAAFAAANLTDRGSVICADVQNVVIPEQAQVFLDPARRDQRGRIWTTAGLSPSWDFTLDTLRTHGGCAKVGPGIAHRDLPEDMAAEWVSHRGDVVECSVWTDLEPAEMAATLLPFGARIVRDDSPTPEVTAVGAYVGEPDGAAIRAACVPRLARECNATLLAREVAYLTAPVPISTPWVTWFKVQEVLPYKEKLLRHWVSEHDIGSLEIKKRAVDIDPAQLRKSLKPRGTKSVTFIISPTSVGVRVMVCERV
ncbi:MAG: THUMP-like domain-containing protein [Propionibacteriaceae bacterium]